MASPHGHSRVLGASSRAVKTAALLLSLAVAASCAVLVLGSVRDYLSYSALTVQSVQSPAEPSAALAFPAITVCPLTIDPSGQSQVASIPLERTLAACLLDSWPHRCRAQDFHSFPVWFPLHEQHLTCYKWNGGSHQSANSSSRPVFVTTKWGYHSGLTLAFRLPAAGCVLSFVGDTYVRPSYRELTQVITPGTLSATAVHKHVKERLGTPYSDCLENVDAFESRFVAELAFRNHTYRQVISPVLNLYVSSSADCNFNASQINCLELCHENNHEDSSVAVAKSEERSTVAAVDSECSRLCPLECSSVDYAVEMSQVRAGERRLAWLLARRERFSMSANLPANSSLHEETALTLSSFYLDRRQVTHSSQVPAETAYSLLAKIGALLSLFLEPDLIAVFRLLLLF